jgi:hypothetical protein
VSGSPTCNSVVFTDPPGRLVKYYRRVFARRSSHWCLMDLVPATEREGGRTPSVRATSSTLLEGASAHSVQTLFTQAVCGLRLCGECYSNQKVVDAVVPEIDSFKVAL